MDEEVLIPQGRLTWDDCEAASSLRIITHQEPCCVPETEQGRACLHSASQISTTPSSSQGKGQQLSWTAAHGQQAHTQLRVSQEKLLQEDGWPCGHAHTHTCSHNPSALQPSICLQLLEGTGRKIPSSKAQLQADPGDQWDASFQPGCSARSCCCCVTHSVWLLQ